MIDRVKVLAENVLAVSNVNRKEAQKQLAALLEKDPISLVQAYVEILGSPSTDDFERVRIFCITQMRKVLAQFGTSTDKLWFKLPESLRQSIKAYLFDILVREKSDPMRRNLSDLIGQLAGTLMSNDSQAAWPEFRTQSLQLFCSNDAPIIEAGFLVLQPFLSYSPDVLASEKANLYTIFNNGMTHASDKVALAAVKCTCSYIGSASETSSKAFQPLIAVILEAAFRLVTGGEEEGLEYLADLVESEPKLLRKYLDQLIVLVQKVFELKVEQGVKKMALEMLIGLAENLPSSFRKVEKRRKTLFELIFMNMVAISKEVDPAWCQPAEGFNEKQEGDDDHETIQFGMDGVDRCLQAIGEAECVSIIAEAINGMLMQEDWRYKYAAIMAISQVGEHIENFEEIVPIVTRITPFAEHQNPMLRYAFCHAVGQIADDTQPNFQKKFHATLTPVLLKLLLDPIPRVRAHSSDALTNFVQKFEPQQLAPHLSSLVTMNLNILRNGSSIEKESAISAIAATAEAAKLQFRPFLVDVVREIFSLFETHTTKEYILLKGNSIEAVTIVAQAVGDHFKPYLQHLIKLMIVLTASLNEVDPQKSYLLSGWQRLCLNFGEQLVKWLPELIPNLFKQIEKVLREPQVSDLDDTEQDTKINTFESEEAEIGISMLSVFVEKLGSSFRPWIGDTCKLLFPIIKGHINDVVREEACNCLPFVVNAVSGDTELSVQLVREFISLLVSTAESQHESSVMVGLLDSLKNCIGRLNVPVLSKEQIQAFSEKLLKLLVESDNRKQSKAKQQGEICASAEEEEFQKEELKMIEEEVAAEEEVQVSIAGVIGILFKTHKEHTVELAHVVLNNILSKTLARNLSDNTHRLAIYILDDIVQFLSQYMQDKWPDFAKILVDFSNHKSASVRQASNYGIGIFAEQTRHEDFPKYSQALVSALVAAAAVPQGKEKLKEYGSCRDNSIASLGKILKKHGGSFDSKQTVEFWLSNLPLKYDKEQGRGQHDFLADLVLSDPTKVITGLPALKQVLKVFGDIVHKEKLCKKETREKVRNFLVRVKGEAFFLAHCKEIWETLSAQQITNLESLLS